MDSANSSPRAAPCPSSSWEDNKQVRLMCSFGGHIIPRPHDRSLCYVGGDTRIVVVDRHTSLADLHSRLSQTLLIGRTFTLKYQLPSEDLDSLISIATEEDLDNMIHEYDRSPHSRLRLFLFPSKPDTVKSETSWFVDVLLNGAAGSGLLPRGLSDDTSLLDLGDHLKPVPVPEDAAANPRSELHQAAVRVDDVPIKSTGDDDRGGVVRKPPLPLLPVPRKLVDLHDLASPDSKLHAGTVTGTGSGGYNLPSPDSVASDCSIASGGSLSKTTFYQDAAQVGSRPDYNHKTNISSNNNNIQEAATTMVHYTTESAFVQQQQPPLHPSTTHHHHHHHHVPVALSSSYYTMYQQQPHYYLHHHPAILTPPPTPYSTTNPEMAAAGTAMGMQQLVHQQQKHQYQYNAAAYGQQHMAPPPPNKYQTITPSHQPAAQLLPPEITTVTASQPPHQ